MEGEWSTDMRDRSSVRPSLELLEQDRRVRTIRRDVGTVAELDFYLQKWAQKRYEDYRLGYFAFHGSPQALHVGRETKRLDELGKVLAGRCQGKLIHFGACDMFTDDDGTIAEFRRSTKARVVSGYERPVEWMPSMAFEMLMVDRIASHSLRRIDAAYKSLRSEYPDLIEKLGFCTEPDWR